MPPSMPRRAAEFAIAAAMAGALAMPVHATDPRPLCEAGETAAFACRMARSGKTVSVCERPGHLTYRFGAPGRIELVLPDPQSPEAPRLLLEEGGNHTLRGVVFPRGTHAYAVTHFVGGRPATEELAVSVQRNGSPVALLKCAQSPRPLGDLPGLFERLRVEGTRVERR